MLKLWLKVFLHFPQKLRKSHSGADDVLIWIGKRMAVPTHFGIIHAINPSSGLNQCEGSFIRCQVVKDVDKGSRHRKMSPSVEDVDIQYAFFNMVYQRRTVAGVTHLIEELSRRYGSHAKLPTRRLRRVTNPSHTR